MMLVLSFDFITGKYHATPWGRHVNEGAVEWPPSPWRILRALIAVWKRTLSKLPQSDIEPILRVLAEPPHFLLPPASTGHTRHYMPYKEGSSRLVFDAFVATGRPSTETAEQAEAPLFNTVLATWASASLNESQLNTLARILANLNRLGRAESLCRAKIVESGAPNSIPNCMPLADTTSLSESDIVYVLCADPATAFSAYLPDGESGYVKRAFEAKLFDPAWNICIDNLALHADHWSDPIGAKWIPYARPRNCFQIKPHSPARGDHAKVQTAKPQSATQSSLTLATTIQTSTIQTLASPRENIQIVRFAIASADSPPITGVLPIAESVRRALMSIYGTLTENNGIKGRSNTFAGKDDNAVPLTGHRHAYYLPTDDDGDGQLDHLTIYSEEGFTNDELRALDKLRAVKIGREAAAQYLSLQLLETTTLDDHHDGAFGYSREWISVTPYIATRHAKTRGKHRIDTTTGDAQADFLAADIQKQLQNILPRHCDDDSIEVSIEPVRDEDAAFALAGRLQPKQFVRARSKIGDDGNRRLTGSFRLKFSSPLKGPISLGFASHFGMGLFFPARPTD